VNIAELPVVRQILQSGNPTSEYKARSLLAGRQSGGTIDTHPYRKWQGPHWTLYSLALLDYPPGDPQLLPLRDQVYDWLLDPAHLEFRQSLLIPGQEDRFRRCASQEGNAIWYSIQLGIDDERTRELARRLQSWQWPDGGWNCDKRPALRRGPGAAGRQAAPRRGLRPGGRQRRDQRPAAAPVEASGPAGYDWAPMNQEDRQKIERIIADRDHAHQRLLQGGSGVYKAFLEMEKAAYSPGRLPKLQKELIAVGIAVVINCESCMEWHIHQALLCGATQEQVLEAVDVGIEMGGGPATVSARFALKVLEYYQKAGG